MFDLTSLTMNPRKNLLRHVSVSCSNRKPFLGSLSITKKLWTMLQVKVYVLVQSLFIGRLIEVIYPENTFFLGGTGFSTA